MIPYVLLAEAPMVTPAGEKPPDAKALPPGALPGKMFSISIILDKYPWITSILIVNTLRKLSLPFL